MIDSPSAGNDKFRLERQIMVHCAGKNSGKKINKNKKSPRTNCLEIEYNWLDCVKNQVFKNTFFMTACF